MSEGAADVPPPHARARAWTLLGRLLLEGPVGELGALVGTLPALAPLLIGKDEDARRAEHHAALAWGVPPYASVFRSADGLLGGDVADQAQRALAACGVAPRPDTEPDHIGGFALAMGFLAAAEADALDDALPTVARTVRGRADALLREEVLPWLPALYAALRSEGRALYAEAVLMMAALAATHRLRPTVAPPSPTSPLDDPDTGLGTIARHLTTPARAGAWIGRAGVARVAHAAQVPAGFGGRTQMLESLLFGAVDHGRLPAALHALAAELQAQEDGLEVLADLGLDVSAWVTRLRSSRLLLLRLEAAARTADAPVA